MDQIRNFQQIFSWFLGLNSLSLEKEGPWAIEMLAKTIGFLYKDLPNLDCKKKKIEVEIENILDSDYLSLNPRYLMPVIELKEYVNSNIGSDLEDFLIHGSIATLDYSIGWSDLDTYVIVKDEVILDPKRLTALRKNLIEANKFLKAIDPLQHHGFIFSTTYDLNNYFSNCLPIEVLINSKSLFKKNKLCLEQYRDISETRTFFKNKLKFFKECYESGEMNHHLLDGVKLLDNYEERNAMYQMKYFLSVLMSMPAFFLDALGNPTYKNSSFEKVREILNQDLGIIEQASSVRNKWQENESHPFENNLIPSWLEQELGLEYFRRSFEICSTMLNSLNDG